MDGSLDDMLSRIQSLREERRQILEDMTAIKTAFGTSPTEEEDLTSPTDLPDLNTEIDVTIGNGIDTQILSLQNENNNETIKKKHKIDKPDAPAGSDCDIICYICGSCLGKLSTGNIIHLGLEDGDPLCPDALHLTEDSRQRILGIATTK